MLTRVYHYRQPAFISYRELAISLARELASSCKAQQHSLAIAQQAAELLEHKRKAAVEADAQQEHTQIDAT